MYIYVCILWEKDPNFEFGMIFCHDILSRNDIYNHVHK